MTKKLALFRELFVSRADVFAVASEEKPGYQCIRKKLVDRVLEGHLAGKFSVGSYVVLPGKNLARILCFDIDQNRKRTVKRIAEQVAYFVPRENVVVEKTGGRGWHVWLLFDSWLPAATIKTFGKRIVTDANPGSKVEIFPKGAEVEARGFGTLVRLPLGKHPRTGGEGELLTIDFELLELKDVKLTSEDLIPEVVIEAETGPKAVMKRVKKWPCIAAIEKGVTEGQRDEAMFALACHYRDQGLSKSVVFKAVQEANEKNLPSLERSVIREKTNSAFEDKAKIGCSTPILKDFCKRNICWLHRSGQVEGKRRTWRVGDLIKADLPPIHWIVQDFLPQGFALLSGKPKVGKSWMVLDLAIQVAAGNPFLGHQTNQGPVLFMALEDGEARIQERLSHFEIPEGLPLQIEFDFDRFGEGGYVDLEETLAEGFDGDAFCLVIIDCLSRAKSTKREELSPEDMEAIVRPLQAWGHALGVCFLLIHHHRKSASGDVIWDARGSGAIVGVADVALGVYEDEHGYRLISRSRDAAEIDYRMTFNEGHWDKEEDSYLPGGSDLGKLAITTARKEGKVDAPQLAELGGVAVRTAQAKLKSLTKRGFLECDKSTKPFSFLPAIRQEKFSFDEEITF